MEVLLLASLCMGSHLSSSDLNILSHLFSITELSISIYKVKQKEDYIYSSE